MSTHKVTWIRLSRATLLVVDQSAVGRNLHLWFLIVDEWITYLTGRLDSSGIFMRLNPAWFSRGSFSLSVWPQLKPDWLVDVLLVGGYRFPRHLCMLQIISPSLKLSLICSIILNEPPASAIFCLLQSSALSEYPSRPRLDHSVTFQHGMWYD